MRNSRFPGWTVPIPPLKIIARQRGEGDPWRTTHPCVAYELASLMSSRARLSAFLDSVLASASGFSTRMALFRLIGLSLIGASHDLTSPLGCTAVRCHFRQLNLICKLWLTCSAATHPSRSLNDEQAFFRVVRGGSNACSCSVSFLSSSLCAASCSVAVGLGPFLIHFIGLYERAAAPAAHSKTLTPAMIHLFFMLASSRAGLGSGSSRPRCRPRIDVLEVRYSPIRYAGPSVRFLKGTCLYHFEVASLSSISLQ